MGLHNVKTALTLVLFGIALMVLTLIGDSFLPEFVDPRVAIRIVGFIPYLAIAATGLSFVGRVLCLAVPEQSRAKGIIGFAVVLDIVTFVTTMGILLGFVPALLASLATLASLVAMVLFILFLMRLANFLDLSQAANQAENLLAWGGFVIVLYVCIILTEFVPGGALIAMLLSLLILIMGAVMFFRYIQLVSWLREAIAS